MFWDFFSQAYKLPMLVLKRAMANPMGIFVYGILSKWYIIVMIATISVTFWVFKGLEKAGVLDAMQKEVSYGFLQAQAVAQRCVPLIVDIPKMWDCIQKTTGDQYVPSGDEQSLHNDLINDLQDSNSPNTMPHPYAPPHYHPYDTDSSSDSDSDTESDTDSDSSSSSSRSRNPYDNNSQSTTTTYDDGIIRSNRR